MLIRIEEYVAVFVTCATIDSALPLKPLSGQICVGEAEKLAGEVM